MRNVVPGFSPRSSVLQDPTRAEARDYIASSRSVALHRFAVFTMCCTAFLIFVGGLVTSTESGLSVPDWPTTYGWNMFDFARIARSYSESPKAVRPTTAHVATGVP